MSGKTRKSPLFSVNFCLLPSIAVNSPQIPFKTEKKCLAEKKCVGSPHWGPVSQDPSFLQACSLPQLPSQDSGSKYRGPEHVWYAEDIKEERRKHRKTENCESICGLEVNLSYIFSLNFSTSRGILNVRQEKGLDTEISLMHMNCEGCEWELLEDLLEDPELVKKVVAVFQTFSFLPNV